MNSVLETKIASLTVIYNNSLLQLSKYCTTTYNSIMRSKLNVIQKRNAINNLNLYYNAQLRILQTKLAADIQALSITDVTSTVSGTMSSNKKALPQISEPTTRESSAIDDLIKHIDN